MQIWTFGDLQPTRDDMQSVSGIASGLNATTAQISLSPMHHQPESRLAQSWAHFQERPGCPTNYKLSTTVNTIEPTLVGSFDTFSLGKFQDKKADGT